LNDEEVLKKYIIANFYYQGKVLDLDRSFEDQGIPLGASIQFSIDRIPTENLQRMSRSDSTDVKRPRTLPDIERQYVATLARCNVLDKQIDRTQRRITNLK